MTKTIQFWYWQKYRAANEDSNMGSMASEPSSPQSSTRSRSPSPDDILERVAADVKEYERENLNTFEASIKAKHNLIAQEKEGSVLWQEVGRLQRATKAVLLYRCYT